ncbi:MAG: Spy/CpxP family protein refolding chaperone [Vicinamibacterales bacterium]
MQTLCKSFSCLVLGFVLIAWPPDARAQGFKWWQNERFQKELALTADQITRIEAIFQTTEPTLRAQKAALDKYEEKLSKVISDTTSDEARVLQAAERVETTRTELSKTRTLMLFRIRRVLSDEQNIKLKALHDHDRNRDRDRDRKQKPGSPPRPEPPACQ